MRSNRVKIIASVLSLAVIAGAGSYGTFSAFSDTTSVAGNTFAAGTLDIDKNGSVSAAFSLSNQRPGDSTGDRCVTLTNSGTLSYGSLSLYATVGGTGLAPYLVVDVDRGTGATGGNTFSCTGFTETQADVVTGALSAFPGSGSPLAEPIMASGASRSYRIRVTLPSSVTASAAEGTTATVTLHWDATS
jgi:predicted ribosomally synthesized peptide with SipW-like signal peptide